jgi:MFS family permease
VLSYWQLLRGDGALPFCAAAFTARMPMAMYSLGTVLMITSLHGSYALAGGLAAAGLAGSAALLNRVAAWADRFGPQRILLPQSVLFSAATAGFIASAEMHAPTWLLFTTGTIGASTMPALGAIVRTGWGVLCGSENQKLQLAFALESANDDLIFILGPVLTTFLTTRVHPAAGLGTAASLSVIGIWCLVRQPCMRSAHPPDPESVSTREEQPTAQPRRWTLPAPGLVTLAPVLAMFGAVTASVELATVAYATAHGHRALAGLILAIFAIGSAGGGLWYGSRKWRAGTHHRLAVTQILSTATIGILWLAPSLGVLCLLLLAVGIVASPTLITGYSILEQQAKPGRETEALSWVGLSMCLGGAVGAAITGWTIDAHGASGGYLAATACAALAATACLAGLASLRPPGQRSEAAELIAEHAEK